MCVYMYDNNSNIVWDIIVSGELRIEKCIISRYDIAYSLTS